MMGETQEQFIARVRGALAKRGEPVPLPDDLEIARVVGRSDDVVARFLTSVAQAKMIAHRVADPAALVRLIIEITQALGARSALVPVEDWPGRDALLDALGAQGVSLVSPDDRDGAFVADVGITGVAMAIAETGSIVLTSGGGRRRLASLAVPVHIGVVRAEQIVPDLIDWANSAPGDLPATAVLVSAPSKTADIELNLVMGVHGPRVEHVIVVG